jgi:hypothetical protein
MQLCIAKIVKHFDGKRQWINSVTTLVILYLIEGTNMYQLREYGDIIRVCTAEKLYRPEPFAG